MRVVGMDVHVRNSFLCVTEADGQLLRRGRVGNTLEQISQFLGSLPGGDQPARVVLESTTNSRAVRQMMLDYGQGAGVEIDARVLHARKVRVIAESVCKCDRIDAAVLNELARSNFKLPACYVPDDQVFALREHLRARSDLVRMRTMLKNCVHSIVLRTMPGMGPITSLTILAELGDINRFKSRAAVSNYVGLVPVLRSSNEKSFSGHITRRGPVHLRAVLVEAAWTAVGRVPQYGAIYQRVSAKKAKQIAIVAVARRMLEDAWMMLKNEEVFRLMTVTSNVTDVRISTTTASAVAADPSDAG
jgi:hypothetical protein